MKRYFVLPVIVGFFLSCSVEPQNKGYSMGGISAVTMDSLQQVLLHEAGNLLILPPLSVTDKPDLPYSLNPGTYMSMACYWWPDPASDDGLPYIRNDGMVNPETRSEKSDLPKLIEMAKRVEMLAVSYAVSQDDIYAAKAIELLEHWFINEETAMLPHLNHAQMIKGRNSGRSFGIIDTWWLVRVVEAAEDLNSSEQWTPEFEQALQTWFALYTDWLYHSEFGQKERRSNNNHGTWYDVQLVTFAHFAGHDHLAKRHLQEVSRSRLNRQIGFLGRQRFESRRPRPLHYSIYNLSGLIKLAELGEKLGVDIKNYSGFYSGDIPRATRHLMNKMQATELAGLLDPLDLTDTDLMYLDLLSAAWRLYGEPDYLHEFIRTYPTVTMASIPVLKNKIDWP